MKSLPLATLHKIFAIPSQPIVALYMKMLKTQIETGALHFFANFGQETKETQVLSDFFSENQIFCPLKDLVYCFVPSDKNAMLPLCQAEVVC